MGPLGRLGWRLTASPGGAGILTDQTLHHRSAKSHIGSEDAEYEYREPIAESWVLSSTDSLSGCMVRQTVTVPVLSDRQSQYLYCQTDSHSTCIVRQSI